MSQQPAHHDFCSGASQVANTPGSLSPADLQQSLEYLLQNVQHGVSTPLEHEAVEHVCSALASAEAPSRLAGCQLLGRIMQDTASGDASSSLLRQLLLMIQVSFLCCLPLVDPRHPPRSYCPPALSTLIAETCHTTVQCHAFAELYFEPSRTHGTGHVCCCVPCWY